MSYIIDPETYYLLPYVPLIVSLLVLPTVVCQAIPLFFKRHTAPMMSFIISITWNVGYGLMFGIEEELFLIIGSVLVGISFVLTLLPFDYCCCSTFFDGNHFVFREITEKPLTRNEFIREMCGNRALAPVVTVYGEAYHMERRVEHYTTRDSHGHTHHRTRTRTVKVTTFTCSRIFKYGSWQEDGNSIRIGNESNIQHAVCEVHYHLDEAGREGLTYLRKQIYNLCLTKDRRASVNNTFTTPGLDELVCGSIAETPNGCAEFYQKCGGRFFWFLFTILGYQSAYEAFWCMHGDRVRLKLRKRISGKIGTYRCDFGSEDSEAAIATFRTDNGVVSLEPALIGNYRNEPANPELLEPLPAFVQPQSIQPPNIPENYFPNQPPPQCEVPSIPLL